MYVCICMYSYMYMCVTATPQRWQWLLIHVCTRQSLSCLTSLYVMNIHYSNSCVIILQDFFFIFLMKNFIFLKYMYVGTVCCCILHGN